MGAAVATGEVAVGVGVTATDTLKPDREGRRAVALPLVEADGKLAAELELLPEDC